MFGQFIVEMNDEGAFTLLVLCFGKIETTMLLHETLFGKDAVRHFDNKIKRIKGQMGSIDRLETAMTHRMIRDDVVRECSEKSIPKPVEDPFIYAGGTRTAFVMALSCGCHLVDLMLAFPDVFCAKFGPVFYHFYPKTPTRVEWQLDTCCGLINLLRDPEIQLPAFDHRLGQVLPYTHSVKVNLKLESRIVGDIVTLVSRSHRGYELLTDQHRSIRIQFLHNVWEERIPPKMLDDEAMSHLARYMQPTDMRFPTEERWWDYRSSFLWPEDDERDLGTRRPQISYCQNYALISWWLAGKRLYTHVLTKRAEQEVIIKREAKDRGLKRDVWRRIKNVVCTGDSIVSRIQQGWKSLTVKLQEDYFSLVPAELTTADLKLLSTNVGIEILVHDSAYKKMNAKNQAETLGKQCPEYDLFHIGEHRSLMQRVADLIPLSQNLENELFARRRGDETDEELSDFEVPELGAPTVPAQSKKRKLETAVEEELKKKRGEVKRKIEENRRRAAEASIRDRHRLLDPLASSTAAINETLIPPPPTQPNTAQTGSLSGVNTPLTRSAAAATRVQASAGESQRSELDSTEDAATPTAIVNQTMRSMKKVSKV